MSWLEENVTYPVSANLTGIEGKVLVAFDVNADGTVGSVHVKESANPLLESEVVSKLQEMPRWIPAFQNGRAVKVKYTLPINFTQQS
jgi:protein TonB